MVLSRIILAFIICVIFVNSPLSNHIPCSSQTSVDIPLIFSICIVFPQIGHSRSPSGTIFAFLCILFLIVLLFMVSLPTDFSLCFPCFGNAPPRLLQLAPPSRSRNKIGVLYKKSNRFGAPTPPPITPPVLPLLSSFQSSSNAPSGDFPPGKLGLPAARGAASSASLLAATLAGRQELFFFFSYLKPKT